MCVYQEGNRQFIALVLIALGFEKSKQFLVVCITLLQTFQPLKPQTLRYEKCTRKNLEILLLKWRKYMFKLCADTRFFWTRGSFNTVSYFFVLDQDGCYIVSCHLTSLV